MARSILLCDWQGGGCPDEIEAVEVGGEVFMRVFHDHLVAGVLCGIGGGNIWLALDRCDLALPVLSIASKSGV